MVSFMKLCVNSTYNENNKDLICRSDIREIGLFPGSKQVSVMQIVPFVCKFHGRAVFCREQCTSEGCLDFTGCICTSAVQLMHPHPCWVAGAV